MFVHLCRALLTRSPGSIRTCLHHHRQLVTSPRAFSLDALNSGPSRPLTQQPLTEQSSSSSVLTRNLSASVKGQYQLLCQDHLDLGEVEENRRQALSCFSRKHYIVDPEVALRYVEHLGPDLWHNQCVIFESNPGPGVLTRCLLNAGAQRVVCLESDLSFIPNLQTLECHVDGQMKVVGCDFFKLDTSGDFSRTMTSDQLFGDLGISRVKWTDDVPVKVVGVVVGKHTRKQMNQLMYNLFEQASIYGHGRVELNIFISQQEYEKLVALPGDLKNYTAFGALWQMCCDIELLHKEPCSSFHCRQRRKPDTMCLVRLRPRADLFSGGLTPNNSHTLLVMVKQCLVKRKARLLDQLNLWYPDSGANLLEKMGISEETLTGQVHPEEFLQLFKLMDQSQEFTQSWLYKEDLENTELSGWGQRSQMSGGVRGRR